MPKNSIEQPHPAPTCAKSTIDTPKQSWNLLTKLTIKKPEGRLRHRAGVFIVNLVQISLIVLVFPLLTLKKQMPTGNVVKTTLIELFRYIF